jgi:hypothetical protein
MHWNGFTKKQAIKIKRQFISSFGKGSLYRCGWTLEEKMVATQSSDPEFLYPEGQIYRGGDKRKVESPTKQPGLVQLLLVNSDSGLY